MKQVLHACNDMCYLAQFWLTLICFIQFISILLFTLKQDGEPIVTVPLTACITRQTALASAESSRASSSSVAKTLSTTYSAARSDEDVIAYFLLRERALVLVFLVLLPTSGCFISLFH